MMTTLRRILELKKRNTIGLMSGTSADALDIAWCEIDAGERNVENLGSATIPYPGELRQRILALAESTKVAPADLIALNRRLGEFYADAVRQFAVDRKLPLAKLDLIGSHGQTVAHVSGYSDSASPHSAGTLQIGEGEILAKNLGVVAVSDFRWADIAVGGRGAPLAPIYHLHRFGSKRSARLVINIGGIANITLLPDDECCLATDTGPGNCLSDHLMQRFEGVPYDRDGELAAKGVVDVGLLERLKEERLFSIKLPTAFDRREMIELLMRNVPEIPLDAQKRSDLIATVCELTVWAIMRGVETISADVKPYEVLVCGGGIHNSYLMNRLRKSFTDATVCSTDRYGSDPDYVEAECFAYLANLALDGIPAGLPHVSGGKRSVIMGKISQP
jgi:anhydro-N-acetylmuramic acid kinase